MNARRWPPRAGQGEPRETAPDPWESLAAPIGDLQRAVAAMSPGVLQTAGYQCPASGPVTDQFRVPYRALTVYSLARETLTVSSAPPGIAPPGPGAGIGYVPPLGMATFNLSGNVMSIYGGSPGELVTVTAFSRPMPPAAAVGTLPEQPSTSASNSLTTPGAFTPLCTLVPAAGPGVYQVQAYVMLTGTPGPGDLDNVRLLVNGGAVGVTIPLAPAASAIPVPEPVETNVLWSTGSIQLQVVGAATAGAVYSGLLVATRVS